MNNEDFHHDFQRIERVALEDHADTMRRMYERFEAESGVSDIDPRDQPVAETLRNLFAAASCLADRHLHGTEERGWRDLHRYEKARRELDAMLYPIDRDTFARDD